MGFRMSQRLTGWHCGPGLWVWIWLVVVYRSSSSLCNILGFLPHQLNKVNISILLPNTCPVHGEPVACSLFPTGVALFWMGCQSWADTLWAMSAMHWASVFQRVVHKLLAPQFAFFAAGPTSQTTFPVCWTLLAAVTPAASLLIALLLYKLCHPAGKQRVSKHMGHALKMPHILGVLTIPWGASSMVGNLSSLCVEF